MAVADTLGEWAAGFRWSDLSEAHQSLARSTVLDTIGCMLSGGGHASVARLARLAAERRPGDRSASAVGPEALLSPADAVLVNGLATGIDVFDGGNVVSRGHVSGYVLPAVLTPGELGNASLEDVLTAYVAGYEVGARIGAACTLRREVFTSGTWGVVGAAAAIARLQGMNGGEIAGVIRLAANLTLASSRGAVIAGATVRDLYSALPSQMGLHAVELAEAGFKGEPLAVETTFGKILAPEFDAARCVAGLGERWLMDRNYTKRYPGCRNFQGAIDCILDALPTLQRPFDAARDRMVVGIDPLGYADNRGLHTESPLAAMESAPVSIALTVVHGRLTPDLYSRGAYLEDRVLALANRLEFAEAERKTPDQRPGWVRIEQTGAAPVERSVTIPSGSAERPMPETELKDKFVRNAKAALGEKAADAAAHILTAPGAEPFRACLARWIGRSG